MGRSPCCSKEGLNRGAWTAMEDKTLTDYINLHGEGKWRNLPKRAGLKRCGKSCRLRWLNYLRPGIKRGNITSDEEDLIIRLHNLLGNRWSLIAGRLFGRTDNEIKNYWNTKIGKRVQASQNDTDHTKTTRRSTAPEPSKASQEPTVVRTKATRCTKAVILPQDPPEKAPTVADTAVSPVADGGDRADHESFVSDFLNLDCLQHFSNSFGGDIDGLISDGDMLGNATISSCNDESGHVIVEPSDSPPSDHDRRREAFLYSPEMFLGVDLPASPIDLELDWLHLISPRH